MPDLNKHWTDGYRDSGIWYQTKQKVLMFTALPLRLPRRLLCAPQEQLSDTETSYCRSRFVEASSDKGDQKPRVMLRYRCVHFCEKACFINATMRGLMRLLMWRSAYVNFLVAWLFQLSTALLGTAACPSQPAAQRLLAALVALSSGMVWVVVMDQSQFPRTPSC